MGNRKRIVTVAMVTGCVLVGAAGGISSSFGATTHHYKASRSIKRHVRTSKIDAKAAKAATLDTSTTGTGSSRPAPPPPPPADGLGGPGGPEQAVHSVSEVLDQAGTAFETVTCDAGTITAVSGQDVTIHEGTSTVAYQDVTITLPADAAVTRNGKTAAVSDLAVGDHVQVRQADDGTRVDANDGSAPPPPSGTTPPPDSGE